MITYIGQRLLFVLFILAAMSFIVFAAIYALPGNTAAIILGQYSTPDQLAALEESMGLDDPFLVQYWRWASAFLSGDLGQSMVMERPVAPVLWDALAKSTHPRPSPALFSSRNDRYPSSASSPRSITAVRRTTRFSILHLSSASRCPEFLLGAFRPQSSSSRAGLSLLPTVGYASIDEGLWAFLSHLILGPVHSR